MNRTSLKIFSSEFKIENWNNYVKMCEKAYDLLPDNEKTHIEEMHIPYDIKVVLIYRLGKYARKWICEDLPILEGKKPIELLADEIGTKALKEALLRMPD